MGFVEEGEEVMGKKKRKCKPSKYAVITDKGAITYGFRCAPCGVHTRRYLTQELRDQRLTEHKKEAKKS